MKLIMGLFILILASCGFESNQNGTRKNIGTSALEELALTGRDRSIAQSICYAFQSKNIKFRTNLIGQNFNFRVDHRACSNQDDYVEIIQTTLLETSNSQPMEFDYTPSSPEKDIDYFNIVQTHHHGYLVKFCEDALEDRELMNTYTVENNEKVQMFFYTKDLNGYDGVSLIYFKEGSDTSYKEIKLKIDLDNSFGANLYGMVYSHAHYELCDPTNPQASNNSKSLTQDYIP